MRCCHPIKFRIEGETVPRRYGSWLTLECSRCHKIKLKDYYGRFYSNWIKRPFYEEES